MLIKWAILILCVFTGFRMIGRISQRFSPQSNGRFHLSYLLPLMELAAWCALLFFLIRWLIANQSTNTLIALGLFLLLLTIPLFYYIRDLIIGVILKVRYQLKPGQRMLHEVTEGKILKVGVFRLTLVTKQNDRLSIAYSKINPRGFIQDGTNPNLTRHLLMFELPMANFSERQITKMLQLIANSPWHVASVPPVIEKTGRHNGTLNVEVVVYVLCEKHAERIKTLINTAINNNSLN